MRPRNPFFMSFSPSLSLWLLTIFFAGLWLAGGSARGDVLGQPFVRTMSCVFLATALIGGLRPNLVGARFLVTLLILMTVIPLIQIIPLPPWLWQSFAGRELFIKSGSFLDAEASWRPLSIAPGATINAAASLMVPIVVVALALGLPTRERASLVGLLLTVVVASTLLSLLQISGVAFDNPLINEIPGEVSGNFANRNHFALLVAIGCMLVPIWCFRNGGRVGWRGPVALGLLVLFALTILASGSRAGIVLGTFGVSIGILLVQQHVRRELQQFPAWVRPVAVGVVILTVVAFVLISFTADRAASINRLLAQDLGTDMRARGLATVISILQEYFWVGHGFGTFDQIFRMYEPEAILQFQYFNQAHNDYLQIMAEGGVAAAIVLMAAISWWAMSTFRIYRAREKSDPILGRLGAAILFLILAASAVDYPVRTPLIMAVTAIAALWLSWSLRPDAEPTLPRTPRKL